jgi:hypothetical protein
MTTETHRVTGPARIALFLTAHRQRIARWLLWLDAAAVVLTPIAARASGGSLSPAAMVAVGAAVVVLSLVFGAWKIAVFVWKDPPARRSDPIYLLVFGAWVAYIGCGSLWLLATNLNQVV